MGGEIFYLLINNFARTIPSYEIFDDYSEALDFVHTLIANTKNEQYKCIKSSTHNSIYLVNKEIMGTSQFDPTCKMIPFDIVVIHQL